MAIKIFVDQGHNPSGPNTGAEGSGLLEQDVTLSLIHISVSPVTSGGSGGALLCGKGSGADAR